MEITARSNVDRNCQVRLTPSPSPGERLVWRRFRRHKMAMAGAVMLILLVLYAFGGTLFFYRGVCQPHRHHPRGCNLLPPNTPLAPTLSAAISWRAPSTAGRSRC